MDTPQEGHAPPASPPGQAQDEQPSATQPPPVPGTLRLSPLDTTQPTSNASTSAPQDDQSVSTASQRPFSSNSVQSDLQLGHQSAASDVSGDRVFPIRSVVSVDPSSRSGDEQLPHLLDAENRAESRGIPVHVLAKYREEKLGGGPLSPTSTAPGDRLAQIRNRARALSGPSPNLQAEPSRHITGAPLDLNFGGSDNGSEESGALGPGLAAAGDAGRSASVVSGAQSFGDLPHITTRFTHVETEDGHAIITGREEVLQQCEDEPIHTPGAVQGFGVLLAMREEADGSFVVRYVSENSEKLLGYTPKQLFRLKNFLDILTEEQQDNMLDHIDFIRDEDADPAVNGPEILSLSIRLPKKKKSAKLWCAIHINPAHTDLVICEFELDDDQEHPLRPPGEMTPEAPYDTLDSNPTAEELQESTSVLSKPLRILRSARKRRGDQGAMQVFDIMSQVQEQLAMAANLETFLKILVGIVKELTGFHRIMIYQFDSTFNGKVVTELVDTSHTMDLYKGLHFPASDIPRQARELYKVNKVRLLYDRDLQTARMVCRSQEDLDIPLDMTHAYLRAMSPIHLKYLGHMEVRSSMSISINAFSELWGLIACHSYGNHGMRVSFPIRKMCRLVGETASRNIERLSYASRLQARKLINTAPTDKNPSGYIVASSDDLLRLFDADFGLLSIKGETKILGAMVQSQEALALLEYLRMRKLTSVVASQDVREDFPDLRYPPGFQVIAGLLYVPLSVGGNDFIVFFRKGQIKEVKWAGNPYLKNVRDGTAGYLEPRTSFKTWRETVVGKCREWAEEQVETAAVLCLVYGKFIEVWRQKEAALESSKLTRLLLANSAHEVRTPLNAIINYLEIALEGSLDQETRDSLARSHSASKSLIYVINDLLDLTKIEEGQNLIKDEIFDLGPCIREATKPFETDARRKGIEYVVTQHPGLPRFVYGDSRRLRQAISNVTANAVSHTDSGYVKIDVFVTHVQEKQATIEFVIADSGVGMTSEQLDTIFQDLEQVSTEAPEPEHPEESEEASDTRALGLGLAVVARIVRNMAGQLRLKSEPGQGSRFVIQLPFQLPDESPTVSGDGEEIASQSLPQSAPVISVAAALMAPPEGEVLLLDRAVGASTGLGSDEVPSAGSRRSIGSVGSHGSQKSDAERLINAIQTPLAFEEKEAGYFAPQHGSKGSLSLKPKSRSKTALPSSIDSPRPSKERSIPTSPARSRGSGGSAEVRDSKTAVRAIKVPDEFGNLSTQSPTRKQSLVLTELPSETAATENPAAYNSGSGQKRTGRSLQVLIAEDDPINMKVLTKRLERAGHQVHQTTNGEVCAASYKEQPSSYDVVLMDIQMPIVDGLGSTKMIRAVEDSTEHKGYSEIASSNGRIPIFAVSASLVERERDMYMKTGFDGWILKPIDFKRLNILLAGIQEEEIRKSCLYAPGKWELGGWFGNKYASGADATDEVTPMPED